MKHTKNKRILKQRKKKMEQVLFIMEIYSIRGGIPVKENARGCLVEKLYN